MADIAQADIPLDPQPAIAPAPQPVSKPKQRRRNDVDIPRPKKRRDNLPRGAVLDNLPPGAILDTGPVLDPNPPPANPPPGFKATPQESFLNSTSVGRVLDAIGEGLSDGYGESALGLSPATQEFLAKAGLFQGANDNAITAPLRAFNEALIRPAAAGLDALFRSIPAASFGIARGAGQTAEELGSDPGMANRLTRDVVGLLEATGIVAGTGPVTAVRARAIAERRAVFQPEAPINAPAIPRPATATPAAPRATVSPATNAPAAPRPAAPLENNINLARINAPEDVRTVITETAEANGGFAGARRGVIPLDETESMAGALGMSEQQLLARKIGEAFSAEEILAARTLLVQSATRVRDLAKLAAEGTDAQRLAFSEAVVRHTAIQEQVAGLTAEAGRALSQFRILAGEAADAKNLSALLDANKGRDAIADQARLIAELDTPAKVSQFILEARKSTLSEKLLEAWINALLSAPQTHVANVIGNTITAFTSVPEAAIAATIGKARTAFKGNAATERVRLGEATGRLMGIVQGARDGVIAGARAFRTEIVADASIKLEQKRRMAIPSAKFRLFGREFELGGRQVRIPGRALMAMDEFFKSIARRQELNALAFRQADAAGLTGTARANRIAKILAEPTKEMREAADVFARTSTFQNPMGGFGNALMALSNSHPLAKIVLPFVRTPINIIKFAGKRTPLGLLSKEIRANILGKNGVVARDQELSRLAMGSMVLTATASLAAEGLITGSGPSDPREMAVLRASGWQPNSVKIGDTYYSYARFEPLALLLGVAADMYELSGSMTDLELEEVGMSLAGSVAKNLTSKTWLRGPSELINALTDPDRYGQRWLQKLAGTVVPTGVAQIARLNDPILRDARSMLDQIRSRIPGLSQSLLPRRDIFGEEIRLEGALGPDILSTIYTSRQENDPATRELLALEIYPSKIGRNVAGIELTPAEYDRLQVAAGTALRVGLTNAVTVDGWQDLPAFAREEIVQKIIASSRAQARKAISLEPEFFKRKLEARQAELQETLGGQ